MSTQLMTMDMMLPIGSLDAYVARVNQIPLLTAEEEQQLAINLKEDGDVEAARRLVMAHLRYVVHVARGYMGYGLPLSDLIQEGNVGLMKAVKRFDPAVGVRLVSFAVHWIRAEIHEFILRNWRIVKVATTKAQRKLFFNLRQYKKRLGWFTADQVKVVADDLGVSEAQVLKMEERLSANDAAYDGYGDDDENTLSPANYLASDTYIDPAKTIEVMDQGEKQQDAMTRALNALDPRSQDILTKRWLAEKKATLQELAATYQVSAERIRQLEKQAMQKLRKQLSDQD